MDGSGEPQPTGYDRFLRRAGPLLEIDWRKYRRRAARRGAEARRRELGLADWDALLARLRQDPAEARAFPDRMRVTVSRFLRERERWAVLMDRVIPELWDGAHRFRAWSAGCCSGEEPYTLAILWAERFGPAASARLEVLATDLDEAVLARAVAGRYQAGSLREMPPDLRARHFARCGSRWLLAEAARRPVRFRRHHLLEDPLPAPSDLVLCRYLAFTYYRGARRGLAACRLWQGLRPGGALMIGRKEGLGTSAEDLFRPWPGAPGVYRRVEAEAGPYAAPGGLAPLPPGRAPNNDGKEARR